MAYSYALFLASVRLPCSQKRIPLFKKWYQRKSCLLFYVPACFASLLSFYLTFYGLRKFSRGLFGFVLIFSFSQILIAQI